MAGTFNATGDILSNTSFPIPATGSLSFWFYVAWARTDGVQHLFIDNPASTNNLAFQKFSDNSYYFGFYPGSEKRLVFTSPAHTANAWNHVVATWTTGSTFQAWINGTSCGTSSTVTTTGCGTGIRLGNNVAANKQIDGRLAEVAFWSAVLDAGERGSLLANYSPARIRPASRLAYWPLGGLRQTLVDQWPSGYTMTNTGVAFTDDHCPVIYPTGRGRLILPIAAAAGVAKPVLFYSHYVNQGIVA